MTTAACLYARYALPYWRYQTCSGSRHFRFALTPFQIKVGYVLLGFKWPQRILGESDCFEACCEGLLLAILFERSAIRRRASCIAWASRKTGAPKLSAALNFLWLLSLFQDKESNMDLDEQNKTPDFNF